MSKIFPINQTNEIEVYYATTQVFTFPVPTGTPAGTEFKLSIREDRNPALNSMCDATGTIADGVVTFSCDLLNATFLAVSKSSAKAWLEVYASGEVFIQRQINIACRAGSVAGNPPQPITLYYTKAEVDNLLGAKVTLPTGGTAGQALVMTEGGTVGWGNAGGGSGTVNSVNNTLPDAQGNVTLTAGSVGALSAQGGTVDGNLNVAYTLDAHGITSWGYALIDGTLTANSGITISAGGSFTFTGGTTGQFLRNVGSGAATWQNATASDVGALSDAGLNDISASGFTLSFASSPYPFSPIEITPYGSGYKNVQIGGSIGGNTQQQCFNTNLTGRRLGFYSADNIIVYNHKVQNVAGGLCVSDATTGNITSPGDVIANVSGGTVSMSELATLIVDGGTTSAATIANVQGGRKYKYGTLASLTLTAVENSDREAVIIFTSGATATVLNVPSSMLWSGGEIPAIEANATYAISICNNLAVCGKFKSVTA